jgi:hypothetical protein
MYNLQNLTVDNLKYISYLREIDGCKRYTEIDEEISGCKEREQIWEETVVL